MEYCGLGPVISLLHEKDQLREDALRDLASCCVLALNCLHNHDILHGVGVKKEGNA